MRIWTRQTAIVASLLLLALPALAGEGWHGDRGKHGRHGKPSLARILEHHAEELGLDDATLQRIREIDEASRPEREALREDARDLRQQLRDLIEAETPDEAAVMAQIDAIGAVKTDLRKERVRTLLAVRAQLTPEQRAKLAELREQRRERFREKFRRRFEEGGAE